MKKLFSIIALLILFLAAPVWAADLAWDYPADWDTIDGYIVYFNETGETDDPYIKNVAKVDVVEDGIEVIYEDYPSKLNFPTNLPVDVTYDIWLVAWNASGASGSSNIVQHMVPAAIPYSPPPDVLPEWEVTPIPGTPYGIAKRVN